MMIYQVLRGGDLVHTLLDVRRDENVRLLKVREPCALGTARYDPLIDIAYEQIQKGQGRDMDRQLIERYGGMAKVEALRAKH